MFEIVRKENLNPTVTRMTVKAPLVAHRAKAGQFVILRVSEDGERIPLTIADFDPNVGTVDVIFQIVGGTTMELNAKRVGDFLPDFVGPLGRPTEIEGIKKAIVVGGGVGCAIALPVARALKAQGADVRAIIGFRSKDLVILENEFRACASSLTLMTDDGSAGRKGVVTLPLEEMLQSETDFDEVIAVGPLVMMKFVCLATKKHGVKTVVSMNPIMIDGTGMCGCCRLTVGGKMRFACVDGPDFDGHLVDFDEAIRRSSAYRMFENRKRGEACNLLNMEVR